MTSLIFLFEIKHYFTTVTTTMHPITGTVIHGNGLGHTIGFPTANIFCNSKELSGGTRRYNVVIKNEKLQEKTGESQNIQNNTSNNQKSGSFQLSAFSFIYKALGPHFPERNLLEVHLLEFDGDLYDQELIIYPLQLIRENQKFDDFYDLTKQIKQDKQYVLDHPITVMTFGTFDHFHPGHVSYLSQAKLRGDKLVTVIALDETVKKIKKKQPTHDELMRKKQVEKSGIADTVVLGNVDNHYQCLLDYHPQVICLGYDQHSFEEGITAFYEEQNRPPPTIIRLDSFEPDKYKSSYFSNLDSEA